MKQKVVVQGVYSHRGSRHVSEKWQQVCADHEDEFPAIRNCCPGTFNVVVPADARYTPPGDSLYRSMAKERGRTVNRYEDENHISPRAKVVAINGVALEAWIYRGGHGCQPILELLSRQNLAKTLSLQNEDQITLVIEEVQEGTQGMPGPPGKSPGKTIKKV